MFRDPKKHELQPHQVVTSDFGKKKGKTAVFNFDYLTSEYAQAMLAGLYHVPSLCHEEDQKLRVLHLGTGAGTMPSFLISQLGQKISKITTVDLSKDMLTVAQKYFGFNPDSEQIESVVADAHEFVLNHGSETLYDIIIMDVNCSE